MAIYVAPNWGFAEHYIARAVMALRKGPSVQQIIAAGYDQVVESLCEKTFNEILSGLEVEGEKLSWTRKGVVFTITREEVDKI